MSFDDDYVYVSKVPYASAVGSLMYAMVCIRPGIAEAMGVLSRLMSNPSKKHWNFVKNVFRYLKGPSNNYLVYHGTDDVVKLLDIREFVDVDWARDLDSRRSTTG